MLGEIYPGEFEEMTEEDLCYLMCGKAEEEPYEFEWIDVQNMLPSKSGDYLVTTENGYVCIAKFWKGMNENSWSGRFKHCVIAWGDLPKPYRRY